MSVIVAAKRPPVGTFFKTDARPPRMRAILVACTGIAVALSGCAAQPGGTTTEDGRGDVAPAADPGWPSLADAQIRPGVRIDRRDIAAGQTAADCTSNFIFAGPGNESLYIGLAAHCVDDVDLGAEVDIADGKGKGVLAYSSWKAMDAVKDNETSRNGNDFAVVLISNESRSLVHPALLHYGGPVALGNTSDLVVGDRVLSYGNTPLRGGVEPTSWHEGVVHSVTRQSFRAYFAPLGIPGDSGSGVITKSGEAVGVRVAIDPFSGTNVMARLDLALEYARTHAALDLTLQTWELFDPGVPWTTFKAPFLVPGA